MYWAITLCQASFYTHHTSYFLHPWHLSCEAGAFILSILWKRRRRQEWLVNLPKDMNNGAESEPGDPTPEYLEWTAKYTASKTQTLSCLSAAQIPWGSI